MNLLFLVQPDSISWLVHGNKYGLSSWQHGSFFFPKKKMWGIAISSVASETHLSIDHSEASAVINGNKRLICV